VNRGGTAEVCPFVLIVDERVFVFNDLENDNSLA
jgi:hypothetical protein